MNLSINLGITVFFRIYMEYLSISLKTFSSFTTSCFCPLLYLVLREQSYEEMFDFISNKEGGNAQDIILYLFDGGKNWVWQSQIVERM